MKCKILCEATGQPGDLGDRSDEKSKGGRVEGDEKVAKHLSLMRWRKGGE